MLLQLLLQAAALVSAALPAARAGGGQQQCGITVHQRQATHKISPLTMGCHSDTGYAHQSRALSAQLIYGPAFEPVPDPPFVGPPPEGYPCKWIGRAVGFNTHGGGPGDVEYAVYDSSGRELSEAEKDASCCSRCDCADSCEFWERDTGSNKCSLRAGFAGFDENGKSMRGNFKNASKGTCSIADPVVASGAGWIGFGGAKLNASSPVPQGLWAPPSRSLLLSHAGDGATNRGFAGEGLFLEAGKQYDGFLVLKSAAAVTLRVSLEPRGGGGAPLATADVDFSGGDGNWTEVPFSLTPSKGAGCVGLSFSEAQSQGISCPVRSRHLGTFNPAHCLPACLPACVELSVGACAISQANNTYTSMDGGWGRNSAAPGGLSDMSAHVCVKCEGQFTIKHLGQPPNQPPTDAAVAVGFASLMPGSWGRYKTTTARQQSVAALERMGIRMIRSGGSVACDPTMAWTAWRGKVWQRPSAR